MSRPDYRIGVLGASRIAPKAIIHPALKREDCTIAAIACRDMQRGRQYAIRHGVETADILGNYETLCARDDIDIIYNALPPSMHLETAQAAAGKVQLIEKPFAMNAPQAQEIANLPGVIMEAFHHRYHPAFLMFLKQLEALGPIRRMVGRFHATIPNRPGELRHDKSLGGGSLMDLGTYPLQIARTIAGREPDIISARAIEGNPGIDLCMQAELDFGDGLTASLSCDMRENIERENYFEVTGDGGVVRMENPVHPYQNGRITTTQGAVTSADHPRWTEITTYDAQLSHLIACLGMGTSPLTDAASAVLQMQAIDAIYQASGLGIR